MNTPDSHTAPKQDSLPASPIDAFRELALGMNNGRRRFRFKFNTEDQAIRFDEMTESVTRRKVKAERDKNIVTVIYKRK